MKTPCASAMILLPVLLTAIGLALTGGCSDKTGGARPNIILITIDALRADRLSCYGYGRQTTPFIDSLAARGALFRHCQSTSCWTPPSMASFCTGVYPREHGVRHGLAEKKNILGQELLADSFITLAEALHEEGYKTFGLSSNEHFSRKNGMAQGFDFFESFWFCDSAQLHEVARSLKTDLAMTRPFFLWIHYLDPHAPYEARKPWIDRYARHPEMLDEWADKPVDWIRSQYGRLTAEPAIAETLSDLYDSGINYTDAFVKRLFDEVLPSGKTLVIISSDHGEAFMEHGRVEHAQSLFHEELDVPLIVIPPGRADSPVRIDGEVSIIDVYPTILDYAGITPPASCRGRSLRTAVERADFPEPKPVFAELDRHTRQTSVSLDRWKLIAVEDKHIALLFDLTKDPGETQNFAMLEPAMFDRLSQELERWMAGTHEFDAPRGTLTLTPQQEQQMRSLGYLR